jgi:phosphoglycerate dehydrogenase-like enzyme
MRFVCADGEEQYRVVLDSGQLARLEAAGHELVWFEGPPGSLEQWEARLAEADGLLLMWRLPGGLLARHPRLRVVSFAGSGAASYVDLAEARAAGVHVCNVPNYGANAVAEHAFALALAVARAIPQGDRLVRSGAWVPGQYGGLELRGRRLGVVGVGPIGARAAEIGRALGMEVVAWTRSPSAERARRLGVRFLPLEELFASADLVSLHLAHTPQTERLIGRRLLSLLKPEAILVNTARGQLIDAEALVELLEQGAFRGAGLDAFEEEPLPAGHPLLRCKRVVLTPHVAFNTPEARAELVRAAIENLLAFAAGTPRNLVA